MIRLALIDDSDREIFFAYGLDPGANWMAAFTAADPTDEAGFIERWRRIEREPGLVRRKILVDGAVAGQVGKFDHAGETQVSYWLDRRYWGRGIATTALGLLLIEVIARPLYGHAAADNIGSIRVLEKCGFKHDRIERSFAHARGGVIDEIVLKLG